MNQQQLQAYTEVINDLHVKWYPHDGQISVGKRLFQDDIRSIFVQCGRKWGKTDFVIYCLFRWAMTHPNAGCYYISPFLKQSKEIVWASNRLQRFLDNSIREKYCGKPNNSELRIPFHNGSFIKCDGSDNFEAYRGIEPHIVVYDEFKDFKPDFHIAMDPNLGVYNAPIIFIGTPPDLEGQYTEIAAEHRKDPEKYHIEEPSERNPHISRKWLEKKKQELNNRGEWDVWEREYMGKYVRGGRRKVFPMLPERDKILRPYDQVKREVDKDIKRYRKIWWADPAGASVFGVLFTLICPYTKKVYLMDEIYETDQKKMTVDCIGNEILRKRDEIWIPRDDDDWLEGYDEAAPWFRNEMLDRFGTNLIPTRKTKNRFEKEDQLSLIKDIMLYGLLVMTDRCEKTYWELDNYIKDDNDKLPKENDHNIDNFRYILKADMYDLNEIAPPPPEQANEMFRGARISDDFPNLDDFGRIADDDILKFWKG